MPERVGEQANPFLALSAGLNPSNAYVSDLFGTWTEFYEAKRSSSTRRRDRTKLKRLGEIGEVRFVTPQDRGEIERSIDMLIEQKSRSFARMGVANMFARPGWSEFFAAVATDERTRSLVHVSRLDVGSTWSAVNLGLVFRDTYCHVLASYDDGETSRFGPGVAHLRELLRYSIEHGLKHFDFTIGDERYKREWSDRTLDALRPRGRRVGARLGGRGHGAWPPAPEALHQAERGALVAVQPRTGGDRTEVRGAGRGGGRARDRAQVAADRAEVIRASGPGAARLHVVERPVRGRSSR